MNRKLPGLRVLSLVMAFSMLLSGFGTMSQNRAYASSYALSMDKTWVLKGDPIEISYFGSESDDDWIGIYAADRLPGQPVDRPVPSLDWKGAPKGDGKLTFNKALGSGEYKAYFLKNGGYEYAAVISFTVGELKAPAGLALNAKRTDDQRLSGTAVITPPVNNDNVMSYKLYWGGAAGVLPDAPVLATVASSTYTDQVAYEIPEGTIIPEGAVSLLASSVWEGKESKTFASATLPGYKAPEEIKFTMMSLNIWEALMNHKYGIEDSAKFIADTIQATGADVVGIQETNKDMVRKAAERIGFYYNIKNHDLSLISRYPIIEVDQENDYYLIEVDPGRAVAVSNMHLSHAPYGPYDIADGASVEEVIQAENRFHMREMRNLFSKLPALADQNMPVFLTGDFNVPSHLDWIEGTKDRHHGQVVEWPVSKKLQEVGLQDSYRLIHPDPVSAPGITWAVEGTELRNPESYDRIDFVYTAGPSITLDSNVVGEKLDKGGPTSPSDVVLNRPWYSDHRAVVSTFNVKPRTYEDLELPSVPPIEKGALIMDHTVVEHGQPFNITYKGAQGGHDWVGMYRKGDTPGSSTPSLKWDYVNELPEGKLTFSDASQGDVRKMKDFKPGEYYIALMLDGGYKENADRVYFQIENKKVTELTITPEKAELKLGKENGSVQLKVEALYNTNEKADVTSEIEISYVSSNAKVAEVTDKGLVKAVSAGEASISVTYDGQTATLNVTVKAAEPPTTTPPTTEPPTTEPPKTEPPTTEAPTTKPPTTKPPTTKPPTTEPPATKPSTPVEAIFSDIHPSTPAKDAFQSMYDKGVIKGTPDQKFNGTQQLTRGDAVVMLNRLLGIEGKQAIPFKDVKEGSYYAEAIASASQLGLVRGVSSNEFQPRGNVKKQDFLVMFYRYLDHKKLIGTAQAQSQVTDKDLKDVPAYAKEAVRYFLNNGFLTGSVESLELSGTVTRFDAVILIDKLNQTYFKK